MGVIDEDKIKTIINLPEDETVAAVIVYGYPFKKTVKLHENQLKKYLGSFNKIPEITIN